MWTRSGGTFASERARAMHISATAEFAALGTDLSNQARYLRSLNFTFAVISWVLKAPLTSVKRWVACPTATTSRGLRPLLTVEQEKGIVEAVLDAARNHKAMTPSAVREMVMQSADFFHDF